MVFNFFSCWNSLDKEISIEMIDNRYTGQGTFTNSNGKYVGEYTNGMRNGKGTYTWFNGAKHEGYWQDGVENGYGTYTAEDGTVFDGFWENGEFKPL